MIKAFAAETSCSLAKSEMYLRSMQKIMETELVNGGTVSLPSFIILKVGELPERKITYNLPNGQSGETNIPKRKRLKLVTSAKFKRLL